MAHTFFDDNGKQIGIGRQLGRGGEAAVYAIEGDPGIVAKIYHRGLDAEKTEKLSRMVELQNERILKLAAWPLGTLRRNGGALAGILMRNVSGFKDIHLLYNPKSRVREFSAKANWRFLLHTAGNLARAFSVIHEFGHVIGDVNQSNVRVSPESAVVSLIDCDSFQVSSNGRYFLCEVGVPLYTPPELQGKEFKQVVRTPNHDNFGLAVLVFHLLFMGRHPYAGRFLGRGEMPIEKAIGEFRFAFGADVQRTQMQPPPNCITLAHLSPEVRTLFVSAFAPSGSQNGRPDGGQWAAALDALSQELKTCSSNRAHSFFQALSACPWCAIEARAGVLLFVGQAIIDRTGRFKLELIWTQIASVPGPGFNPPPDFSSLTVDFQPTAEAKVAGRNRRLQIGGIVLGVAAIVVACFALGLGGGSIFIGLFCAALARSLIRNAMRNKEEFKSHAEVTAVRVAALQRRWRREASDEPFAAKLRDLKKLREEYAQLPNRRQQKIDALQRDLYGVQLRRFLEQFPIASADIPHVKENRKVMLSSYGIDDAADVTPSAVAAVPGFGQFLTEQLLAWRRSLESKFQFDPSRGIEPLDVQRIDQQIAKRRLEIELTLSRAHLELIEIRCRVIAVRHQLEAELQNAWVEMAQARENLRVA